MKVRALASIACAVWFSAMPSFAFEIPLGKTPNALGVNISQKVEESAEKTLSRGPASIKYAGTSLWAADTLKNRIVEFDVAGKFKSAVSLKMPKDAIIGDFCFGFFGEKKEKALIVCDANKPMIYAFRPTGDLISQLSNGSDLFAHPYRIEFFDNRYFVLDSVKNEIVELDLFFKPGKKLKTFSNNFTIQNKCLIHCILKDDKYAVESNNLVTGETKTVLTNVDNDVELDFIACNQNQNSDLYVGFVDYPEYDEEAEPQYYLMKYSLEKQSLSKMATSYPVGFMVNSFIKDKNEKLYQIKFDEHYPNKLYVDEVPETFGDAEG